MEQIYLILDTLNAILLIALKIYYFFVNFFIIIWQVLLDTINFFSVITLDKQTIIIILIDLAFAVVWSLFFIYYSTQKTIKNTYLLITFLLGMVVAFLSFFAEKLFIFESVASILNPSAITDFIEASAIGNFWIYIKLFLTSFFFIALIEEGIKFIFLRRIIASKKIDQVIDGMKVGIWLGLGFAFLENFVYFINFVSAGQFNLLNVIGRGFLSTLAHGLFGALMGYYLVLAKISNSNELQFRVVSKGKEMIGLPEETKKRTNKFALGVALLAHGYFNFFLFLNLGIYSIIILTVSLVLILLWYGKRKNNELYFEQGGVDMIFSPEVAADSEAAVLENSKLSEDEKRKALLSLSEDKKDE